jgi:hypothetical protein
MMLAVDQFQIIEQLVNNDLEIMLIGDVSLCNRNHDFFVENKGNEGENIM